MISGTEITQWFAAGAGRESTMQLRASYYGDGAVASTALGYYPSLTNESPLRKDGRAKTQGKTNWVRYVVDMHTGFNLANRVNYTTGSGEPLTELLRWYEREGLHAADMQNFSNAVLQGEGVELAAWDGKRLRFIADDPSQWAFVEDEYGTLQAAARRYQLQPWTMHQGKLITKAETRFTVWTPALIETYASVDGKLIVQERKENMLRVVPVIRYQVGPGRRSHITTPLMQQVDLYDVVANTLTDDIKYAVDSFLQMKGIQFEPLLVKDDNGVTVLEHIKQLGLWPTPKDAELKPIEKTVDVEKFKYDLRVRRMAIHLMGCVPDLTDTVNASGASTSISGIALKLLFQSMIQKGSEFRKHYREGLEARMALVNRFASLMPGQVPEAPADLEIKMQPNIPQNDMEWAQYGPGLVDVLAVEDIQRLMPFVDEPSVAAERWAKQKAAATPKVGTAGF